MSSRVPLCLLTFVVASLPASAADVRPIPERFAPKNDTVEVPNFRRHVIPLLGRLGCNGRNCHGSFQGAGGFRLSMFGFDFTADQEAIAKGDRPRVDVEDPDGSKLLIKPTDADGHKGGLRFPEGGWEYRALRAWIAAGARDDSAASGDLLRVEVTPKEILFDQPGRTVSLRAIAIWADGTREDVTALTRFSTNDDAVATVSESGIVTGVGRGDTAIIASYDSAVESTIVVMPVTDRAGANYPNVPAPTKIDELVIAKLRKLGVVPSEVCSDSEFLRRASLDITGTLPTPEEIRTFLADKSADKRDRKIDELLDRPAYSLWWATKFCDWTGLNAPLQLGHTEFARPVGEMWTQWIRRRFAENTPYDQIAEGYILAVSRHPGESYEQFAARMSTYTRSKDPADFADEKFMPYYWYRANLGQPDEKALAFAYSFLGVRLDCAQCHKHPFDRWSQQDFKQFAAVFTPIKTGISPECESAHTAMQEKLGNPIKDTAANRRGMYLRLAAKGEPAPWRELYFAEAKIDPKMLPKLLGAEEVRVEPGEHPLSPLMAWLRRPDNPYFAKAFVNRVWAGYFGAGIVDPPDDLNLGNPPSNPALLDYLASEFIAKGYDVKWLHKEIVRSQAYQRKWQTNETNAADTNFSRALVRRLPAEVALDAILQATAAPTKLATIPTDVQGRRIGEQATADFRRTEYPLVVFGKPLRLTNCDCERITDPSLLQSLFLRNDPELRAALDRKNGWLATLKPGANPDSLIEEAYLRTVSRPPTDAERKRCREHLAQTADSPAGLREILWALLNTKEFITNH